MPAGLRTVGLESLEVAFEAPDAAEGEEAEAVVLTVGGLPDAVVRDPAVSADRLEMDVGRDDLPTVSGCAPPATPSTTMRA